MELTNPTSTSLPSWASELIPDLHDAIWSGGGHHDHAAWCALEVLQRRGLLVQSEPEGVTTRELQWPPSVAQGCHEAAAEAEPGSPMQQLLVAAGDLLENYARRTIEPAPAPMSADTLAEIIREVDGNHGKGAAALAEAILSHPGSRWSPTIEPEGVTDEMVEDAARILYTAMRFERMESTPPWVERGNSNAQVVAREVSRAVLTRYARPAIQPVAVSERLPEPGKKVIAYYLNALGNSRTILAEWVPAKTKADDGLTDDDFAEYDEESDEYYWPEGWYEVIENWDDYGAVFVNEGEITHWRPLPPGPHHALPLPQRSH